MSTIKKKTIRKLLSVGLIIAIILCASSVLFSNAAEYVRNPEPQVYSDIGITMSKTAERTGKNTFDITLSATVKKTLPSARIPVHIVLVADGSISTNDDVVTNAINDFAVNFFNSETKMEGDMLGVVRFSRNAKIVSNLQSSANSLNADVENNWKEPIFPPSARLGAGTNIIKGLQKAQEIFNSYKTTNPSDNNYANFVIVISDGITSYANQATANIKCNTDAGTHVFEPGFIELTGVNDVEIGGGINTSTWDKNFIATCSHGEKAPRLQYVPLDDYIKYPNAYGLNPNIERTFADSDLGTPTVLYARYLSEKYNTRTYSIKTPTTMTAYKEYGEKVMKHIATNGKFYESTDTELSDTLTGIVNDIAKLSTPQPQIVLIRDYFGEYIRLNNPEVLIENDIFLYNDSFSWIIGNNSPYTNNPDGSITYSITYSVTLDVKSIVDKAGGFENVDTETFYPTNGDTFLSYVMKNNLEEFSDGGTKYFNVPEVKGEFDTYRITYNKNGGSGSVPADNTEYFEDTNVTILDGAGLTYNDKYFMGWNTEADGTGTHYNKNDILNITADTTLYAMWLDINKTSDSLTSINRGNVINYSITAKIPENVVSFDIKDRIPDGATYNNDASDNGSFENDVITWTISNAAAGETYTRTFSVTVNNDVQSQQIISNTGNVIINNITYSTNVVEDQVETFYTVVYNSNGGEGNVPTDTSFYSVNDNVSVQNAAGLSKQNHQFMGWNTKPDGLGEHYDANETFKIKQDTTLYAMWLKTLKTSTAEGGVFIPGDVIDYSLNITIPENSSSIVVKDVIPTGTTYKPNSAICEPNSTNNCTIAYEDDTLSWTFEDVSAGSAYLLRFKAIISNTATNTSLICNQASIKVDSDTYYTNKVEDHIGAFYNVIYNANGGTGSVPVDSTNYSSGNLVVTAKSGETLSKDNYRFAGWNTTADGTGINYAAGDTFEINQNTTLYAMWLKAYKTSSINGDVKPGKQIDYTINITIPNNVDSIVVTDKIPAGTTYKLNSADNGGIYEDGVLTWNFNSVEAGTEYTLKFSVTINSTVNIGDVISNVAEITIGDNVFTTTAATNTVVPFCKVTYNANSGTGPVPVDNTYYSAENPTVTVKSHGYISKANCQFIGWNTSAAGTGTHYEPNDTFVITENTTLYAMWLKAEKVSIVTRDIKPGAVIKYAIAVTVPENMQTLNISDSIPEGTFYKYDANDMSVSADNKVRWRIQNATAGDVFTRAFSVIVSPDVQPGQIISNIGVVTLNGKTTYSTNLVETEVDPFYKLIYDSNGGSAAAPTDETWYSAENSTVSVMSPYILDNEKALFTGWNTEPDGTGTDYGVEDTFNINQDTTLYAMWLKAYKTSSINGDVKPGKQIDYTINITIPNNIDSVVVTDKIPAGTTYKLNSADNGGIYEDGVLTWNFNSVEADTEYTLKFSVTINSTVNIGDVISNVADITIGDNVFTTTAATNTVVPFCKVTYNANSGTGPVPVDNTYYSAENLSATVKSGEALSKNTCQFFGWNTSADGTGTHYDVGDTFNVEQDTTLYAMWLRTYKTSSIDGDVKPGKQIDYTINITIPDNIDSIVVTDEIPAGTTYKPNSADNGGIYEDGVLTWNFNSVDAGTEYILKFSVTINSTVNVNDEISNVVDIEIGNNTFKTTIATNIVDTSYKVTYDSNGGSGLIVDNTYYSAENSEVTVKPGEGLFRENYRFAGWNTVNDGTGTHYKEDDTFLITENTTLYAMWLKAVKTSSAANDCFKPNELIDYTISVVVPEDTDTLIITDTIPENTKCYTYRISDGGEFNQETNTITWTITQAKANIEYTRSFAVTIDPAVTIGSDIQNTANIFFNNIGYHTNTTSDKIDTYYHVRYDANGGTGPVPSDSNFYSNEEKVTVLDGSVLTKDGQVFVGWNTVADGSGTHYNTDDTFNITQDTSLYASWMTVSKTSSITGDIKPGKRIDYTISVTLTENISPLQIKDAIPVGTQYNNDASNNGTLDDGIITWTVENAVAGELYTFTFSVTITANVRPNSVITNVAGILIGNRSYSTNRTADTVDAFYTVTYNANGGEGSVPVDNTYYSEENKTGAVMGAPDIKKEGYQFFGWNSSANGTGTHYNVSEVLTVEQNLTLYAMWAKVEKVSEGENESLKPGNKIQYSISVTVPDNASILTVKDAIPAYTKYNNDANTPGVYNEENKIITWTVENATAGRNYIFTFSITIDKDAQAGDIIHNTASVESNDVEIFTNQVENIIGQFFTMTYDANKGIGEVPIDNAYYYPNASVTLMDDKTLARDGYVFTGWNTKADGSGTKLAPADTFNINANTTVYAMWLKLQKTSTPIGTSFKPGEKIRYDITLNFPENNSNILITDKLPNNVIYNNDANLGGVYADGILTWIIDAVTTDTDYVLTFTVTIEQTVTANDEIANIANVIIGNNTYNTNIVTNRIGQFYNVVYNSNGAEGTVPIDPTHYLPEAEVIVMNNDSLTKVDYQFAGWNTKADGSGTHFSAYATFNIVENTTLYAMWLKAEKYSTINSSAIPGKTVVYTIKVIAPENLSVMYVTDKIPTGTKYTKGVNPAGEMKNGVMTWTVENVVAGTEYVFTLPVTISAQALSNSKIENVASVKTNDNIYYTNTIFDSVEQYFVISYNSNGGTGSVPTDSNLYVANNSAKILPHGSITKTGFTFVKWNTKADGSGVDYLPGSTFTVTENLILYATWEKNPDPGHLTIRKVVKNAPKYNGEAFSFIITFDVEGSFPYTGSHQGTIKSGDSIALKGGEFVTIEGLPVGTKYSIQEVPDTKYDSYSENSNGTIQEGVNSSITFINTPADRPKTGDKTPIAVLFTMLSAMLVILFLILRKEKRILS